VSGEIIAGIVAAVLAAAGLVWIFAGRWVSASRKGSVAKDDLTEARASLEAIDRAERVGRNAPKTPRSLTDWLRGKR